MGAKRRIPRTSQILRPALIILCESDTDAAVTSSKRGMRHGRHCSCPRRLSA